MFLLCTLFLLDADVVPVVSLPAVFILPAVTNWPLSVSGTVFIPNPVPVHVYCTLPTINPSSGKSQFFSNVHEGIKCNFLLVWSLLFMLVDTYKIRYAVTWACFLHWSLSCFIFTLWGYFTCWMRAEIINQQLLIMSVSWLESNHVIASGTLCLMISCWLNTEQIFIRSLLYNQLMRL